MNPETVRQVASCLDVDDEEEVLTGSPATLSKIAAAKSSCSLSSRDLRFLLEAAVTDACVCSLMLILSMRTLLRASSGERFRLDMPSGKISCSRLSALAGSALTGRQPQAVTSLLTYRRRTSYPFLLVWRARSLGVHSLVCHPACTLHGGRLR